MVDVEVARKGPRILGRYAIYDAIASGGMATVHYGRLLGPVGFSRTVAIKRLHPQFARDPEFVAMFLDEARLAGRIRHPNVVPTLDVVASQQEIFLVMDYVHGESLARIIRATTARQETVPLNVALRIASDVLQGLHAAHEARDERGVPLNIVHRDISPQNILVGVDGISRLVDFGVAKAAGQGQTTRDGQIKGKLGYMAPEQLKGVPITRQTDIHAFATVLWEMLTGKRLFAGETETETVARVIKHEIPKVTDYVLALPPAVDSVLAKGLADSLERRFATAREMCVALDSCGPMANSMQVADWLQIQAHDILERRAQAVGRMERDQETSGSSRDVHAEGSGSGTAKEWVARLAESGPDGFVPGVAASVVSGSTETSVSAIEALPFRHRSPLSARSLSVTAILGLLGLVVVLLATRGSSPSASSAASSSSSGPATDRRATVGPLSQDDSRAAPPVVASASTVQRSTPNEPLAAAPSASALHVPDPQETVAPKGPTTPRPAHTTPHAVPRSPTGAADKNVFDSRE